jgi:endoglucanase Acf2
MNFSTGCFLWGSVTGNTTVRDLGAMLYSVENAAIQQYWFDADNAVYPAAVSRKMAGLVWSYGAEYATWFSGNPWQIHGINFLPLTAGSTYLGRRPDAMLKNWGILQSSLKPSDSTVWLDINYSMLATADAALADQLLTANANYAPEAGDSRARTEHWIKTWRRIGKVDLNTRADVPTYAAFKNKDVSHRFAWNPSASPLTVNWSDGRSMVVAPGQVGYWRDFVREVQPKPTPANPK